MSLRKVEPLKSDLGISPKAKVGQKNNEQRVHAKALQGFISGAYESLEKLRSQQAELSKPVEQSSSLGTSQEQNQKNIQSDLGNSQIKKPLIQSLSDRISLLVAWISDKASELETITGTSKAEDPAQTDEPTKNPQELEDIESQVEPQNLGDSVNNRNIPANPLPKDHPDVKEIQEQVLNQNLKEAGAQGLGNKNTQVSQFAGNSNTNGLSKAFGINGDCGICAGVSAARILGVMQGNADTAMGDIEKFRGLAKPDSNHFQGTTFDDLQRGAEGLGLQGEQLKGNSDDVLAELKKGNVPIVSVNSKEYGVLKKKKEKVGHAVTVEGFDEKTNSFIVNDSLLDKQISVPKDVFERAMKSAKFAQGSILSLSKKGGDQLAQNNKPDALLEKPIQAQILQSSKPKAEETDSLSRLYTIKPDEVDTPSPQKKPDIDIDSLPKPKSSSTEETNPDNGKDKKPEPSSNTSAKKVERTKQLKRSILTSFIAKANLKSEDSPKTN